MADIKIFTDDIEETARKQVENIAASPAFAGCRIRIMPDVHAGKGCVIGFTSTPSDKVMPNVIGVDIGCGMAVVSLGKTDIDYAKLDYVIRHFIPSGKEVREEPVNDEDFTKDILCRENLNDIGRINRGLGTLGGGNHFIEVDVDEEGNKYLIIHSGSRNLGLQVANIYQKKAETNFRKGKDKEKADKIIKALKEEHREKEIEGALKELKSGLAEERGSVPHELSYLEGKEAEDYLHDMRICQRFAYENRKSMAETIVRRMGWEGNVIKEESFETIHNYIDDEGYIRKGAVSARKGERLLIPLNMRDGCIVGRGLGNEDWNFSTPHGAGRAMSRKQAKQEVNMDDYFDSMCGIWTSCVSPETMDEAPFVYKSAEEIVSLVKDTADIEKTIRPVYNFKAAE